MSNRLCDQCGARFLKVEDGQPQVSDQIPSRMGAKAPLVIGGGFGESDKPRDKSLSGVVDEVMLFRRVVSAEQLNAYVSARTAVDCP